MHRRFLCVSSCLFYSTKIIPKWQDFWKTRNLLNYIPRRFTKKPVTEPAPSPPPHPTPQCPYDVARGPNLYATLSLSSYTRRLLKTMGTLDHHKCCNWLTKHFGIVTTGNKNSAFKLASPKQNHNPLFCPFPSYTMFVITKVVSLFRFPFILIRMHAHALRAILDFSFPFMLNRHWN